MNTVVESIRARHKNAQPSPSINPAWANAEKDLSMLLREYDVLAQALELATSIHVTFKAVTDALLQENEEIATLQAARIKELMTKIYPQENVNATI